MRISAQNNQFIFSLPYYLIEEWIDKDFNKLMEKNYMPYDSVMDYINSTIKEVVFPSMSFNIIDQSAKYGKKIPHKESGNIFDKYTSEIEITFRATDSYLNFFIMQQILIESYLNTSKQNIPFMQLSILDKNGDCIYTVNFEDVIFKGMSEIRLGYQQQDINDKTFNVTFRYTWLDIKWELNETKESKSIFDIPLNPFIPKKLDRP